MNKQNVILNVVDMLNTYKAIIPKNKLKILESRKWLPLTQNSDLAPKAAFMVGKIMGDGNLDGKFTCRFIGQLTDLNQLKDFITKSFSVKENNTNIFFRHYIGKSCLLQINDSLLGR